MLPYNNEVPHRKGVCRSGSVAPCILNLGASWRCVVSFTFRPLYSREMSNRYTLNTLGGSQSLSGCFGEERNLLALPPMKSRFLACAPIAGHCADRAILVAENTPTRDLRFKQRF